MMRNRALIGLSITCIFIAACTAGTTPTAAEALPPAEAVVITSAPLEAGPTNTTIPLPPPQNPLVTITLPAVPAGPVLPGLPVLTGAQAIPAGVALNCRTGPHKAWQVVTVLPPDQGVEIAGQSEDGAWWYVKNPVQPGGFCWISAEFAKVTGNVNNVPKIAASPAPLIYPTPEPSITRIDMGVDPDVIEVPGCVGPIQSVTAWAFIHTDGELEITVWFWDDTAGEQKKKNLYFPRADIGQISSSFTPQVIDGVHTVTLETKGLTLASATYEIKC
ncbi:MAG: hypothetical protein FJZ87_00065 [Chloroflexi bacterium]|nr:hypothetical protein [Chloroflexota bacterium]